MLDKLRRHRDSYAAKFVLFALAASFVIGFGVLPSLTKDRSVGGQVVAKVEGRPIYRAELDRVVKNLTQRYREQYGTQLDDKTLAQLHLDQVALQTLINRAVILREADKAGLRVTDDDLRSQLMEYDAFKDENGNFDPRNYERAIRNAGEGLTPAKFESDTRDSLVIERMQALINNSIQLTDDQLREIFVAEREKAMLAYVGVGAEDVAGQVKVNPDDVKAYYDAHKANFALPERRRFKYLEVSPNSLALAQKVDEKDLQELYTKHKEDYKEDEQVHAAHILFKVEGDDAAKWEAAHQKAIEAAKKAKSGGDFAQLAKTLSNDSSASSGGDLGFFGKGQMVKPFEEAAFAMKPGEISEPIRTQFGWHVIKILEHKQAGYKTFDEVRATIERQVRTQKAQEQLAAVESGVKKDLDAGTDLDAIAKKYNLKVETTEFLTKEDRFPGVLDAKPLMDAGFALNAGQTSKVIDAQIAKYVLKLDEIQAPKQRALEEVRPQVEQAVQLERAGGLAAAKAAELLDAAKKAGSLRKVAGKFSVKETPEFAQIDGEVPGFGKDPDVFRAAFTTRPEKPIPDRTFTVGGKVYVLQLIDRKHADMNEFANVRETFARERLQKKQESLFSDWLQAARGRTKVEVMLKTESPTAIPGTPGRPALPEPQDDEQGG